MRRFKNRKEIVKDGYDLMQFGGPCETELGQINSISLL